MEERDAMIAKLSDILWDPTVCRTAYEVFWEEKNCFDQCDKCMFASIEAIEDFLDDTLRSRR